MIGELKPVQAAISLWVFFSFHTPRGCVVKKHELPHRFIASIKSALLDKTFDKIYCS
jgi:hypothetical protein